MKISELTLAELRLEHARHQRDAAQYQELTRARYERGDGPHPNLQEALGKAEEYAVLLRLAEEHNGGGDDALAARTARLLEQCDREENCGRSGRSAYLTTGEIRGIMSGRISRPASAGPDSYAE